MGGGFESDCLVTTIDFQFARLGHDFQDQHRPLVCLGNFRGKDLRIVSSHCLVSDQTPASST